MNIQDITITHETKNALVSMAKEKHPEKELFPCNGKSFDESFTIVYVNHKIKIMYWYNIESDKIKNGMTSCMVHVDY